MFNCYAYVSTDSSFGDVYHFHFSFSFSLQKKNEKEKKMAKETSIFIHCVLHITCHKCDWYKCVKMCVNT